MPDLYRIEVPLHGSPLKATNCYAIKGPERSLVIDTGWNREECRQALGSGLQGCGIDLNQVDFFLTHMHADHSGLVSTLACERAKVYIGEADARIIRFATPEHWQEQIDFAIERGFPRGELERAIGAHPGRRYSTDSSLSISVLRDGDAIGVGQYLFECVETPGHTQGHLCLYERGKKILVCGDHILVDITPNITLSSRERNPLAEYLMSLDKVYDLDVELVLPGHRSVFSDHRRRIRELKHHHRTRLDEIISILGKGRQNAFQIASGMTWDIDCQSWDLFPSLQKLFAFAETMAHVKYLEEEGRVGCEIDGQGAVFFIAPDNKEAHT